MIFLPTRSTYNSSTKSNQAAVVLSTQAVHAQSASTYIDARIEKDKSSDLQVAIADLQQGNRD